MNQLTTNYSLDLESVSVIKTHMFSLCAILAVLVIFIKFVLPKILTVYEKKLDLEKDRLEAEKAVIKTTLIRWTDNQEKINTSILSQFDSINSSLNEIKEVIKLSLKLLFIVSLSTLVSCDSDTVTVYKFKSKDVVQEKQYQVNSEDQKSCNPPCNPPKTSCNTKTGKCEGAAAVKESGNLPTSDLLFYVQKFGWPKNSGLWR